MYHAGSFRVLVTMAVLIGMVSLPGRADGRAPTFTHDDILTVLRDQQARIDIASVPRKSRPTHRYRKNVPVPLDSPGPLRPLRNPAGMIGAAIVQASGQHARVLSVGIGHPDGG
jgi:hypothetical protein